MNSQSPVARFGAAVSFCAAFAALFVSPFHPQSNPNLQVQNDPSIVISEILAHADDPYVDAVELYNPGVTAVDLSGWLLTDDDARPQEEWVRIPNGATISAQGYFVIADTRNTWSFGLSEAGDEVYIFRPDVQQGTPVLVDATAFGASPNNVSLIRHVDSSGRVRFPMQEGSPTLRRANCGVRISPVQLDELMIDPPSGESEYVVIANAGSAPAVLYDPDAPENTWMLVGQNSSGKDSTMFVFPQGVTLAMGERIIVSEVSPELFRQEQNVPASVRIFGPLESGLSSTGERVALAEPQPPELDGRVNHVFVDEVEYSNRPPWPSVAENGMALVRRDSTQYANDVANWRAAAALETVRSASLSSGGHYLMSDIYLPFLSGAECVSY